MTSRQPERTLVFRYDGDGRCWFSAPQADVTGMRYPARCTRCGHVYDLAALRNVLRYAECDVWSCPGCRVTVSDRTGSPDHHYTELGADGYEKRPS